MHGLRAGAVTSVGAEKGLELRLVVQVGAVWASETWVFAWELAGVVEGPATVGTKLANKPGSEVARVAWAWGVWCEVSWLASWAGRRPLAQRRKPSVSHAPGTCAWCSCRDEGQSGPGVQEPMQAEAVWAVA